MNKQQQQPKIKFLCLQLAEVIVGTIHARGYLTEEGTMPEVPKSAVFESWNSSSEFIQSVQSESGSSYIASFLLSGTSENDKVGEICITLSFATDASALYTQWIKSEEDQCGIMQVIPFQHVNFFEKWFNDEGWRTLRDRVGEDAKIMARMTLALYRLARADMFRFYLSHPNFEDNEENQGLIDQQRKQHELFEKRSASFHRVNLEDVEKIVNVIIQAQSNKGEKSKFS